MRDKDKYINILIVGYGGKSVRSFKVNRKLLKFSAFVFTTSLIALSAFAVYSFKEKKRLEVELSGVREENKKLAKLLIEERERNRYLESFKEKVEELEGKLITIDNFLRKKGVRRVPKSVGGLSEEKIDKFDIEYVSFLTEEAEKLYKYLTRIPLGPPVWGKITSKYGYRRDPFTGKFMFHYGVDIKAPWGTPVRATAEGKVIFAGWKPGYGRTVIIKHAYGFKTVYAHLSKIEVKKGIWVKSGQIIGRVGSSGRATGPHLHYEIWRYSRHVNPIKYMYVRW